MVTAVTVLPLPEKLTVAFFTVSVPSMLKPFVSMDASLSMAQLPETPRSRVMGAVLLSLRFVSWTALCSVR